MENLAASRIRPYKNLERMGFNVPNHDPIQICFSCLRKPPQDFLCWLPPPHTNPPHLLTRSFLLSSNHRRQGRMSLTQEQKNPAHIFPPTFQPFVPLPLLPFIFIIITHWLFTFYTTSSCCCYSWRRKKVTSLYYGLYVIWWYIYVIAREVFWALFFSYIWAPMYHYWIDRLLP